MLGHRSVISARIKILLGLTDYFSANLTGLCKLMTDCGSDKAGGWHNYAFIYHWLFRTLICTQPRVLEIGIGTNFAGPSSMGASGVPGASLRAWKIYFRTDAVFGADIDKRILFDEPGIPNFFRRSD